MGDIKALVRGRALLLIAQIRTERNLSWTGAAYAAGIDPSYASKLAKGGRESVGNATLRKISQKLGLDTRFFTDPSLGDAPDYRQFIGTRVERDGDLHPVIEQVILDRRATPEAAARLRAVPMRAFGGTPDAVSVASVLAVLEADVRREAAGDATPKEPPPVPEGRRRVGPGKRGR